MLGPVHATACRNWQAGFARRWLGAVSAGDAFVVEADFKGTWEIIETVRKHFDFRVSA